MGLSDKPESTERIVAVSFSSGRYCIGHEGVDSITASIMPATGAPAFRVIKDGHHVLYLPASLAIRVDIRPT